MKQKTGRKLLSFLLTLAMVFSTLTGIMPGMALTAYADESTSEVALLEEDFEGGSLPSNWSERHTINNYAFHAVGQLFKNKCHSNGNYMMGCWVESTGYENNTAQLCTPTLNLSDYTSATLSFRYANPSFWGDIDGITVGYKIGNNDIVDLGTLPNVSDLTSKIVNLPSEALKENVKIVFTATCHNGYGVGIDDVKVTVPAVTPVTDITDMTLNPSTAQTICINEKVSFTATVSPDNATDKTVKWSVGGTNSDAVKLYTDANCTTEVGADATDIMTVYAKGISAGSAIVTATSNADSEKKASCDVTVNAAATAPTGLTATYGQTLADVALPAGWDKEIPETMPAENMTIKAKWTVNQYTMTFDDNGSHSEYVLDYGENLTDYIPEIQWEGHTFMGWNPEVPETVPAEDMTFTAVWDTNTYTITFDSNGGSYVAPIVQDFGTKVIAPMNPMREGYAFIGWDMAIPETMPAYDMTVRAQWVKAAGTGAARISSGTARVPSGTAQPAVTVSSTDEITPKMWAVLNDDNSVTVGWEKIKNADSYILYVEKDGKAVKLTDTKDTEVTLKKAKNGVTYKFSLKYTRNGSTFSAPKGYKANLRAYYKPAVTATVTKDGKILLKWNEVKCAEKYVIYRVNSEGRLVKAGTTTKTAARIAAKSIDKGYVVRASVNGKMTTVTKSDIVTVK